MESLGKRGLTPPLTADEVAEYMYVHTRTVRRWAVTGKLPSGRCGRKWLFQESTLRKIFKDIPLGMRLFSVHEIAGLLAVPVGTIKRWPVVKADSLKLPGSVLRIPQRALEQWVSAEIVALLLQNNVEVLTTSETAQRLGIKPRTLLASLRTDTFPFFYCRLPNGQYRFILLP